MRWDEYSTGREETRVLQSSWASVVRSWVGQQTTTGHTLLTHTIEEGEVDQWLADCTLQNPRVLWQLLESHCPEKGRPSG